MLVMMKRRPSKCSCTLPALVLVCAPGQCLVMAACWGAVRSCVNRSLRGKMVAMKNSWRYLKEHVCLNK